MFFVLFIVKSYKTEILSIFLSIIFKEKMFRDPKTK